MSSAPENPLSNQTGILEACKMLVGSSSSFFRRAWLDGPAAILQHARHRFADKQNLNVDEIEALLAISEGTVPPTLAEDLRIAAILSSDGEKQFWAFAQALSASVLVADDVTRYGVDSKNERSRFAEFAAAAFRTYSSFWTISYDLVECHRASASISSTDSRLGLQVADDAIERLKPKDVPSSAWLMIGRVLCYLLGDEHDRSLGTPPPSKSIPILLVDGRKQGHVVPLTIAPCFEGEGAYLDPLTGFIALDPNMKQSLNWGWRAALGTMREDKGYGKLPAVALRLAIPNVPAKSRSLQGKSVGGMFALGMVAAATNTEIDENATGSFALKRIDLTDDEAGEEIDKTKPILRRQLTLVPVGDFKYKLPAAAESGLTRILHAPQQKDVDRETPTRHGRVLEPRKVDTLDDAWNAITTNARIEDVLLHYSEKIVAEWEQLWTTDDPTNGSLLYYVPPAYRLFTPEAVKRMPEIFVPGLGLAAPPQNGDEHEPLYEDFDDSNEDETLARLLMAGGERLCIVEGPGAGKSVFTKRVRAYLSSDTGRRALKTNGRALLVVRWEENSRDFQWPADYLQALADSLISSCRATPRAPSPEECVKWALENGRVVLILDALDQTEPGRIKAFRDFVGISKQQGWKVRMVVTGRPFAVEGVKQFLDAQGDWRFGAVLPFDIRRQHRYLVGPIAGKSDHDDWSRRNLIGSTNVPLVSEISPTADEFEVKRSLEWLFPFYGDVSELLGNPNALWMVRSLAARKVKPDFRNTVGLYLQTSAYMLQDAEKTLRASRGQFDTPVSFTEIERWQRIIAAAAFEMMTQSPEHHRASGQQSVEGIRRGAAPRVSPAPTDEEWRAIEHIGQLTNRTLLNAASRFEWAFPSRRIMEFYAAYHLANNTQPNWRVRGEHGEPRCGDQAVRDHAADPQWKNTFRLSQEFPSGTRNDESLLASLAELFHPDAARSLQLIDKATGQSETVYWRRPAELMWRSLPLLVSDRRLLREYEHDPQIAPEDYYDNLDSPSTALKDGPLVIQEFQATFRRILEGSQGVESQKILSEFENDFVSCPPKENDPTIFWMGENDDKLRSRRVQVQVDRFRMQTSTVTVAQFDLFDASYRKAERDVLDCYARDSNCPAIYVNWWDSVMFALWSGSRLPTGPEWEFACRAGTETDYAFGGSLNQMQANIGHFDDEERAKTSPVRSFDANAWGLFDMHGNVSEWCSDLGSLYKARFRLSRLAVRGPLPIAYPRPGKAQIHQRVLANPRSFPSSGGFRMVRGGSFMDISEECRSAFERSSPPNNQSFDVGFRVSRTFMP